MNNPPVQPGEASKPESTVQLGTAGVTSEGDKVRRYIRTWANLSAITVFLCAIAVPFFGYFLSKPPKNLEENREPAKFPELVLKKYSFQSFPDWFELHFNDHMGGREYFLKNSRRVNTLLGESSSPKAWLGRDGWIYLNVDDTLANKPTVPTMEARLSKWADVLAERQAYLAERGIIYIVLLIPEKSTIYPEHLPLRRFRNPPPHVLPRMTEILNERGVVCVDVTAALKKAKESSPQPVFFKTDSHWTPTGARVGYEQLTAEVQKHIPEFQATPLNEYEVQEGTGGGDLWLFVRSKEDHVTEPCVKFVAPDRVTLQTFPEFVQYLDKRDNNPNTPVLKSATAKARGPKILLLRDSFSIAMEPFFYVDFAEVTTVPTHRLPVVALGETQPKIVVQQIVERFLYQELAEGFPR